MSHYIEKFKSGIIRDRYRNTSTIKGYPLAKHMHVETL